MIEPPIRPESVEVLLFDLGGVVIDIDFQRCMARWARSAGREVTDISSRFSFDAAYKAHERGALAIAGYLQSLRRTLSLDLTDEQLLAGWNDIYVGVNAEIVLLAQVKAELRLYAFTNSNPTHQAIWSQRFAAELEVFTSTFVSSEIGYRKPDRPGFDYVTSLIGTADPTPSSNILFFDDSPKNVAGALDAGMQAVHVTSTKSVRSALTILSARTKRSATIDRMD